MYIGRLKETEIGILRSPTWRFYPYFKYKISSLESIYLPLNTYIVDNYLIIGTCLDLF